jgi:hypothetical protein
MEDPDFEARDSGYVLGGEWIARKSGSDNNKVKNINAFFLRLKLKE